MATSKKTSPERTPTGKREFAFVKFELGEDERKQCKAWNITPEELDSTVAYLNDRKYTVSLKFDAYNKCYGCFITALNEKDVNFNLCLSGRGSTPLKALKQALFKHNMCDAVWPIPNFTNDVVAEIDD